MTAQQLNSEPPAGKPDLDRTTVLQAASVDAAISSRRSVRQFLPTPVTRETTTEILDVARYAPSGHNTQPWQVHVLTGGTRAALSEAILEEFGKPGSMQTHAAEFDSYPSKWISPYIDRRRKVGKDMYTLLGIERGDTVRMEEQVGKNFSFFGAPVGFIFTIERLMIPSSAMDLGMFLQSIMVAARARGLDTCMQAALALFHRVTARVLDIPDNQIVMGGMSLGYADENAIVNRVVAERASVGEFTRFHG